MREKVLERLIKVRSDWDNVKYDIMLEVLRAKFQDEYLKTKLLETDPQYLEETNYWHDNFFGNCICDKCKNIEGKNYLGKILMKIRDELKV